MGRISYKPFIQRYIAYLIDRRAQQSPRTKVAIHKDKEREIVVWLRLQETMDKPQMIEFMQDRFGVSKLDAETIFEEAFPDGLTEDEERFLDTIDSIAEETNEVSKGMLVNTITFLLDGSAEELKHTESPETTEAVIDALSAYLTSKNLL